MRLLLISHFFPPDHTAGTEKRTLGYATELMKLGHNVQVVCAGDWDKGKKYWNGYTDDVFQGIPVRRIHLNWQLAPDPNRYLYDNPLVEEYLLQWLADWKSEIVHVTSCMTLSASVIRAAKRVNLPVVFTLTDFWSICPRISLVRHDYTLCDGRATSWDCLKCLMWHSGVYHRARTLFPEAIIRTIFSRLSKFAFVGRLRGFRGLLLNIEERKAFLQKMIGSADCLTAPSAFLANLIQSSVAVTHPIRVIYSGHDLSWLAAMPEKAPSGLIRFGYIGQIVPVKGLDLLLSAFISAGIESKAQLSIYGEMSADPLYTASLKKTAAGNCGIRFMGAFPPDQLGQVLSQLDILVVPSQWHENNPRVIQEAFASKTPVIASNVGGISEFVQHEKNGLLFERDNVQDLGAQLRCIVEKPELLVQLRDGITPAKKMQEEVKELEHIYHGLASRKFDFSPPA